MHIRIHSEVFRIFPDFELHGIVWTCLDQERLPSQPPLQVLQEEEAVIKAELEQLWQQAFQKFPHPKKARCALNFLNRAFATQKLRSIHPLVDAYNVASILSQAPFGGEDLKALGGELILAPAHGDEPFTRLGHFEPESLLPGELAWFDRNRSVVCRSLNWSESEQHKIHSNSDQVIFLSERPTPEFPDPGPGIDWLKKVLAPASEADPITFRLCKQQPNLDLLIQK